MYCKLLPRGEEERLNKNIIAIGIKNNRIYFIYSNEFIEKTKQYSNLPIGYIGIKEYPDDFKFNHYIELQEEGLVL